MLTITTSFSQTKEEYSDEIYPAAYSFEKAKEFEQLGEYDKAIWFYINLYPENKPVVIELVNKIADKLDTVDMNMFIKTSFASYITFDPEMATINNGVLNMDMTQLTKKGAWGDELILKISDLKPLSTAMEYNLRSIERFKVKDYQGSLNDLDIAIDMEPSGQFYFNRGYTKSFMDNCKGAIEDYTKTIELNYRLADAYFERAYCKELINDPENAITDYSSAINIRKDYADAYNNRGFVKYNQKNYKAAIKDFDKAIKIKPDYGSAYFSRGTVKQQLGNQKGACSDWKKAFDLGYSEAKSYLDQYCK